MCVHGGGKRLMTQPVHCRDAAFMPSASAAQQDGPAACPTLAPLSAPRTETTMAAPASVPSLPLEVLLRQLHIWVLHVMSSHSIHSNFFVPLPYLEPFHWGPSVQAGGLRRVALPTSTAFTTPARPAQRATTASSGTTGRGPTWWPPERPWWCDQPTSDGSASPGKENDATRGYFCI